MHPIQNCLWQRPRQNIQPSDSIWYCSAPMGPKPLGDMMAIMSAKYKLSQRYTNHSIRVTSLQVLEDQNIEGRHIIRISGHKSTDSVQSYARRLSASRKRNISACFSNHLSSDVSHPDASETHKSLPKQMRVSASNNENISSENTNNLSINNMLVSMPPAVSALPSKFANLDKSSSSSEGSNSNSFVDFEIDNGSSVDDATLAQLPGEMLNSFNSFNNCNNCRFVFHVHMHQK